MARPTKQGIDYFPLDCQFDDKIEMYLIEKEAVGLAVLISIWQIIYSNQGYYITNNNDLLLIIKRRINVDINEVNSCINVCLRRNIFCCEMHDKHGILTSKAIQKRFYDAAQKKKSVQIIEDYVINPVSEGINWVYVAGNATNVNVKEEVKEEVKEKICDAKASLGKSELSPPVPVQEIINLYHELLPGLPRCAKLTTKRKSYIQQRWREDMPELKNWRNFFVYVGQSNFLMGKAMPVNGRQVFRADIEWICNPTNFTKIAEGKYHVR